MKNSGKSLVIVESPSKAKTIAKFLGSKYKVVASVGYVRDLPKSKLKIDIENNLFSALSIVRVCGRCADRISTTDRKSVV